MIEVTIDRAAAGGRMLARHDGVVVLVAGAIPGERVRARVERSSKSLIWATVVDVIEPSPRRRPVLIDPACGGSDYLHIDYAAQCALKSDVLIDAFRRIGKMSIDAVAVTPSREYGYRLRARLHVDNGRAGFFLEGTHTLCDAAATQQLSADAIGAAQDVLARLGPRADRVASIVVSENVRGSERVLHLEPREGARIDTASGLVEADPRVTGVTIATGGQGLRIVTGRPTVTDTAADLLGDDAPMPLDTAWTRHAASFFQGNRYVTGSLLRHVLALTRRGSVADLYAGVGLFAVACAARGDDVTAVENEPTSGEDLDGNGAPFQSHFEALHSSVEEAASLLKARAGDFETVIVDPPRAGLSPRALDAVVHLRAAVIVYVSCDPATLARDAQKLVASGYRLASIQAFDLFPNTAHVESVVEFVRQE